MPGPVDAPAAVWQPRLMPGLQRLLQFPAYETKPDADALLRDLAVEKLTLLDNNEEYLGPSPAVSAALAAALSGVNRYPDGYDARLRGRLAAGLGVERDQIVLGTGSNAVLETLGAVFLEPGSRCVIPRHAFAVYAKIAVQNSAVPAFVPERAWTADIPALIEAAQAERTAMVFVANPNNPTGTRVGLDGIEALLAAVPERVVVVVDEAYADYAGDESAIGLIARHPNLVVTRTFSKVYALAGLRIGYAVSSPQVCAIVRRAAQPYTVSTPAVLAAEAAYADREHRALVVRENAARRRELVAALAALGLAPLESHTNFVTVELPVAGAALAGVLERRAIFVRDLDAYAMPNHIRITVGGREELGQLLDALRAFRDAGWALGAERAVAT
jgi:histidinol-phosphate aminotransferase